MDPRLAFIELAEEKLRRQAGRKLFGYYPDDGPLRRSLYPKHMAFFEAGKAHRERAVIAGNRVGKTEGCGGYEVALHLTGLYPAWWPGRRFDRPVNVLCGGDTATTTRDIIVRKMLGLKEDRGTGLIPRDNIIGRPTPAPGIPDHVDVARVRHITGGASTLQFRSYDQGRVAWQGTERDVVWLDEEPPEPIYVEALTRTMTTGGMLIITATPLNGLTDVVLSFLPDLAPAA
jgi:phage terminase large subunit-like protein